MYEIESIFLNQIRNEIKSSSTTISVQRLNIYFFFLNIPRDLLRLTPPLTSKRCILYIYSKVLNILNMVYTLRFFLFKMQFVS